MLTNVLMIAYGPITNLHQSLFSLTSLYKFKNALQAIHKILIYTDNPSIFNNFFKSEKVETIPLSTDKIKKWRGPKDFVHRLKLEAMKDTFKNYPTDNLFYVDSDTYFTKSPLHLFNALNGGTSVMHINEGQLKITKDILLRKIYKFAKKNPIKVKNGNVAFKKDHCMWNAGVIGLSPENSHLLDIMLSYADQAYDLYPKFVMEQWAVSLVLQNYTKILPASKEIFHYWNNKDAYNENIAAYLKNNTSISLASECLNTFSYPPEPVKKKYFLKKLVPFRILHTNIKNVNTHSK